MFNLNVQHSACRNTKQTHFLCCLVCVITYSTCLGLKTVWFECVCVCGLRHVVDYCWFWATRNVFVLLFALVCCPFVFFCTGWSRTDSESNHQHGRKNHKLRIDFPIYFSKRTQCGLFSNIKHLQIDLCILINNGLIFWMNEDLSSSFWDIGLTLLKINSLEKIDLLLPDPHVLLMAYLLQHPPQAHKHYLKFPSITIPVEKFKVRSTRLKELRFAVKSLTRNRLLHMLNTHFEHFYHITNDKDIVGDVNNKNNNNNNKPKNGGHQHGRREQNENENDEHGKDEIIYGKHSKQAFSNMDHIDWVIRQKKYVKYDIYRLCYNTIHQPYLFDVTHAVYFLNNRPLAKCDSIIKLSLIDVKCDAKEFHKLLWNNSKSLKNIELKFTEKCLYSKNNDVSKNNYKKLLQKMDAMFESVSEYLNKMQHQNRQIIKRIKSKYQSEYTSQQQHDITPNKPNSLQNTNSNPHSKSSTIKMLKNNLSNSKNKNKSKSKSHSQNSQNIHHSQSKSKSKSKSGSHSVGHSSIIGSSAHYDEYYRKLLQIEGLNLSLPKFATIGAYTDYMHGFYSLLSTIGGCKHSYDLGLHRLYLDGGCVGRTIFENKIWKDVWKNNNVTSIVFNKLDLEYPSPIFDYCFRCPHFIEKIEIIDLKNVSFESMIISQQLQDNDAIINNNNNNHHANQTVLKRLFRALERCMRLKYLSIEIKQHKKQPLVANNDSPSNNVGGGYNSDIGSPCAEEENKQPSRSISKRSNGNNNNNNNINNNDASSRLSLEPMLDIMWIDKFLKNANIGNTIKEINIAFNELCTDNFERANPNCGMFFYPNDQEFARHGKILRITNDFKAKFQQMMINWFEHCPKLQTVRLIRTLLNLNDTTHDDDVNANNHHNHGHNHHKKSRNKHDNHKNKGHGNISLDEVKQTTDFSDSDKFNETKEKYMHYENIFGCIDDVKSDNNYNNNNNNNINRTEKNSSDIDDNIVYFQIRRTVKILRERRRSINKNEFKTIGRLGKLLLPEIPII